ncbi:hypothetical protein PORY_001642 [Pneumocystis oryctolagi]|uniref:Uncharacterized protein n=1 Tax=Pneumocystis oryctolagi TaxID=42067 RepID=A0ACB7CB51_9ASCO|nr:hypothetical protein PORY_001642 [Pneumocystis oryctolagi]
MLERQALGEFMKQPVRWEMIVYLAEKARGVLECVAVEGRRGGAFGTPFGTPFGTSFGTPRVSGAAGFPGFPTLEGFISMLCEQSNVQVPTLMSTVVYLERLQRKLPRMAKGMKCTCHRVFLASLILAAKYLNDSSPKNKHWAKYTSHLFSLVEVNLMEKQLLVLLDWDLSITTEDLYKALAESPDESFPSISSAQLSSSLKNPRRQLYYQIIYYRRHQRIIHKREDDYGYIISIETFCRSNH